MSPTPKTIQIFLPGGDPRGIRVAEITTRIVQVIEVPRSLLSEFYNMEQRNAVGLYFLIGNTEEGDTPQVYIGHTGNLENRLYGHNRNKDFWERALLVTSLTGNLTQTHTQFLEWHCIQEVRSAGRYNDENGNSGSRPHTPAPLEADCLEIFETASTLLATLGHPLFLPIKPESEFPQENIQFFCTESDADGRGLYTQEGFVVLAGSSGRAENTPSLEGTSKERERQQLLDSGVTSVQDGRMVFLKDHLFGSPSLAASVLIGRHANGWHAWVNKDGKSLDKIERQAPEA